MRRNGYLWTSGVNLDTTVPFPDPDFLLKMQNFGDSRRFSLIIAFYIPNVRHISTDLESIPHTSTTMAIITTKFEVDMIIDCRVKVFCLVIRYVTLWSCRSTFWPWNSCHSCHVTTLPPSSKTIRLCVLEISVITFFTDIAFLATAHAPYHVTCA